MLVAEGLLTYLGPRGWVNRVLLGFGLVDSPIRLMHNYWGVMLSLVITGFPFTFLLTLSYVTGIDPALEQAGADAGGPRRRSGSGDPSAAAGAGAAITLALPSCRRFRCSPRLCCSARRQGRRG